MIFDEEKNEIKPLVEDKDEYFKVFDRIDLIPKIEPIGIEYFKKELKVTLRKGKDIKEEYLPIEKLRESVLIETDNEHVKSSFYDDYSLLYVVVKIKNLDRISVLCRDNKVAVEIICEKLPENIINSFEATRVICQKLI